MDDATCWGETGATRTAESGIRVVAKMVPRRRSPRQKVKAKKPSSEGAPSQIQGDGGTAGSEAGDTSHPSLVQSRAPDDCRVPLSLTDSFFSSAESSCATSLSCSTSGVVSFHGSGSSAPFGRTPLTAAVHPSFTCSSEHFETDSSNNWSGEYPQCPPLTLRASQPKY